MVDPGPDYPALCTLPCLVYPGLDYPAMATLPRVVIPGPGYPAQSELDTARRATLPYTRLPGLDSEQK